ncbi:NarK/NasA family nitrate transporter [Phaeovibrio sulfidiphilus]|uniref:NarK/NasA family nitrate transporter n=1 Tax=Phaeovibrio sulfidiphilus TaxID=1220600 RepID=A0A8J7CCT4_9PROT|nr:nitrate/nitrite transporter [Phaeovibrio sulfidiphilus]MBE1237383.1 NarK/NasA family nitrate transporter [Phaeovibrio sulfidiphilus]
MTRLQDRATALVASTAAFTVCFAVWTIFAIIGVRIKEDLGLSQTAFSILIGTPILTGSLVRLLLGIWADRYGGRPVFALVMIAGSLSTFALSYATTYPMMLLAALGLGISGGSFAVGITYVSKWYPPELQGTALGIFGMGNIGTAFTKLLVPLVMAISIGGQAIGWQGAARIWALVLLLTAVGFWVVTKNEPELRSRRHTGNRCKTLRESLRPLRHLQVWRFSLYYFVVFGAFVALALWLPDYFHDQYGMSLPLAGALAATFSIAGSGFRALGGWMSDRYGARKVMYWTFAVTGISCFLLSYPPTDYLVHGIAETKAFSMATGVIGFTVLVFCLGLFMSFGKAAVYKYIPHYYPDDVGAVAGIVGLVGGLGGWILPICFGLMNDLTDIRTSCFMLLFVLIMVSLIWMHMTIRRAEKRIHPSLDGPKDLPEFDPTKPQDVSP